MSEPDLSEFFQLSRPRKPPCQVGHARSQIGPSERAQLDAACDADKGIITAGAIQQWLKARKQMVSIPAITNHRKGNCTCVEESNEQA